MNTKVYVGDLGPHGNKDDLEHEFEQYGTLKSVWVARNPPGFAFVEFEDPRDAEEAVRDMDGKMIGGVRIRVEHAKNRQGGGRGGGDYGNRGDYRGGGRRGNSFNRYRRSPPRRRSRSPYYKRSRSRSPAYRGHRSRSPPYRRSPSPRRYRSPPSPRNSSERDDRRMKNSHSPSPH